IKLGKIVNLTIVAILVTAYIVFSLPPSVTKPVKAAASDAILATTGYTALPLHSLAVTPPQIPPLHNIGEVLVPEGIFVNATRQLTVYAVFKNFTATNTTKATRVEDVTANSSYRSSNANVATVNGSGFIVAMAPGSTNVTISYTASPGSANLSAAAEGKTPITVTFTVPVTVRR
ncbi:MAG: hypothetical protein Q7J73_03605, partial [Dehalococcoidales bacterium]|nr:hypothetical protein [Dehalococcoidales bacterium]